MSVLSLRLAILSLALVCHQRTLGQHQPGMVEKSSGGAYFSAEQYKIDRMRTQPGVNTQPAYKPTYEFEKPSKEPHEDGSIWIGNFCRFRKPGDAHSRYHPTLSEWWYCNAKYPKDTTRFNDNFTGGGTIPWAANVQNSEGKTQCQAFLQRMPGYVADGLPFQYYDSLQRLSWFMHTCGSGDCYTEGRDHEFARGIRYYIKRKEGSENEYIKFAGQFVFSSGDDRVDFLINDKGKFKIDVIYDNWKTNHEVVETGRATNWASGEWNEVFITKDAWNMVRFFVNGEQVYNYTIPDMPIATRFTGLRLEMPYQWENKGLKYNVGEVIIESYPQWPKN